ncbi:MAG: alanine--tRNA ligase [Deltaproteobacteria bacterium]|jgi:alanyl-tRNA synthetase|nr:alanine--tRNA ligase [Deltaproteobacteria bacterium]
MSLPAREIREIFLRFFEERGHRRVASASLVPESDPTLMFVNAGMVPFKRTFLGEETRDYTRATTSQKCMRVSGKHNDLENVGRTPRHHTFFEMLGNFSFGDYFKREAIEYAWTLLTEGVGIPADDLVVSVFEEDDEAFGIWRDHMGLPESKIYRLDEKENFWSMGDTGPCGPCSEIHYDWGALPEHPDDDPSSETGRFMEIWNLVFMQFARDAAGEMTPLPKPSIDTGGGLERWAAVLQGVRSSWESDAFLPLIERAAELSGIAPGEDAEKDVSLRVVADHARALAFLIGDGVLPSNAGRGYVLRRILRRGSRHGVLLGQERPFIHSVADAVIDQMGEAYPELVERRAYITDRIRREEERFLETLSKGLTLLEGELGELRAKGASELPGETVFKLYDTYGFPVDLTADILVGHGMTLDQAGFDEAMGEQKARARAAWKGSGDTAVQEIYGRIASNLQTTFRGYETLELEVPIAALLKGGESVPEAQAGDEIELVFDETPFYAESGGQVGDRGRVVTARGEVEIRDVQKPVEGLFVHQGVVREGTIAVDEEARLVVDAELRQATVRNHTGTHLLHAALREVLGEQAMQKGSLVGPERLRFDFTHDAPLTRAEVEAIEDRTNEWIEANASGSTREMDYKSALEAGAVAIFEEKYGDRVRVVSFGDCSTELCGGTHARATGEIGLLKIVSESGIAAGIRRIEALTGAGALRHIRAQEQLATEAARQLKVPLAELPIRVGKLIEERKEAQRQIDELRARKQGGGGTDLFEAARELSGIPGAKAIAARVEDVDAKAMRTMVDDLRNRLGTGIVCLAADAGSKALLAIGVTKDLTDRLKAGDLIREVAGVVGGGGGGRPDFAQAGGKDPSRIDEALARFEELVGP